MIIEVIIMTNTKSAVNVKIDTSVKEMATLLLARMGIDQTTAIDMFYRQIIKEKALPFKPEVTPTLDEQIVAAIEARNIPIVDLDVDDNGNIHADPDKDPAIYDWAVNG
jgi:DNA-damage-inducible protein J